ncbi:MAG: hypothetical protein IKJ33_05655 [Clostridia bacterium]|nr:hypothetical protein [Clostridia bacterium]
METMEEYKVIRIINEEPEFCEVQENHFAVDYFILCEEGYSLFGKNIYDLQICGMSLLNWVVRVCERQPKILKINKNSDILEVVKPYIDSSAEYSVVFYADTPLLNKNHIKDLLAFIDRKRMNVCKFKRGLAFRNNYIKENDEIYSVEEYDFASNDFYVVENSENFEFAKNVLSKKVLDYHKKNGVLFENESSVTVDANTEIGVCSRILSNASIINGTKIGRNVVVQKNAMISGSTVGNDSYIGNNSIIDKSIVKDNTRINENVVVKNSVIGNNVNIDLCSNVYSSSIRDYAELKNNVCLENGQVRENCVINKYSKILGLNGKAIIGAASRIGANAEIVDSVIPKQSIVEKCSKITGRVEEE